MVKSVKQQWEDLARRIFTGPGYSDVQRREMRRAFYAGYYACLMTCCLDLGSDEISEERGAVILESQRQECLEFQKQVAQGRA